jgi:hypothetical protein
MYFVGAGTALGVASVALLSWKVWKKMNNKTRKRKGAAF